MICSEEISPDSMPSGSIQAKSAKERKPLLTTRVLNDIFLNHFLQTLASDVVVKKKVLSIVLYLSFCVGSYRKYNHFFESTDLPDGSLS